MRQDAADLNRILCYLARRDVADLRTVKADLVVLLGNSLPVTVDVAALAFHSGVAPRILISGGVGHSTELLYRALTECGYGNVPEATECQIFANLLRSHHGLSYDSLLLESRSTNCGSNALESRRLLEGLGLPVKKLLLIQDPTMQRRTHACFQRAWREEEEVTILSFAPFVPRLGLIAGTGLRVEPNLPETANPWVWPLDRLIELAMGEIRRLRDDESGYGPRGANYFDHVDIPPDVAQAHHRLSRIYSDRQ